MSRATPDDQLKFLLSCVKHSNNGKIDFVEVAQECTIVSKGAAAKRYERLMKANGINPNGGPDPKPLPPSTVKGPKSNQKEDTPKAPTKRRRMNNTAGEKKQEDIITSPRPKPEPPGNVKMEDRGCLPASGPQRDSKAEERVFPPARGHPMPTAPGKPYEAMENDESNFDFNEFCSPEMFTHCAPATIHRSLDDGSLPASMSLAESATFNNVQRIPHPVRQELKREKEPERETVVIAD